MKWIAASPSPVDDARDAGSMAEADGLIMAMSHRRLNVHGVQFHPESIASEHGKTILANFLELARAN